MKSKIESDLVEYLLEILNVHLRGEVTATTKADGAGPLFACFLIERDTERQRPLHDVEEFAERQIQQQRNHTRRMGHADKRETIASHGFRADGQHQAGHRDGEKQKHRKHIVRKTLNRKFASIAHAKLHRKNQAHNQDNRRDVQQIEMQKSADAVNRKLLDGKSEKKDSIGFGIVGQRFKMNPAENQRKCEGKRKHASP